MYTVWVVNFKGFKFSWISWLLAIHKMNHDVITAQAMKLSADPRKYKPTNSLCFSYPRNFKPSKVNTLMVVRILMPVDAFIMN